MPALLDHPFKLGKGAQAPLSPHIAQVYSATPIQKKGMPKIDDRGFN